MCMSKELFKNLIYNNHVYLHSYCSKNVNIHIYKLIDVNKGVLCIGLSIDMENSGHSIGTEKKFKILILIELQDLKKFK